MRPVALRSEWAQTSVAVLQLRADASALQTGVALRRVPGVASVAVDLDRAQVIVRYDPTQTDEQALRARASGHTGRMPDSWLGVLLGIARVLPLAAGAR